MQTLRTGLLALALTTALAAPGASFAANACRDANGKFIKCPVQVATPATRCKDARGKFVKCSAPGAKPVTAVNTTASAKLGIAGSVSSVKPTKSPLNPAPAGKTP
jgi:hypothetical protein